MESESIWPSLYWLSTDFNFWPLSDFFAKFCNFLTILATFGHFWPLFAVCCWLLQMAKLKLPPTGSLTYKVAPREASAYKKWHGHTNIQTGRPKLLDFSVQDCTNTNIWPGLQARFYIFSSSLLLGFQFLHDFVSCPSAFDNATFNLLNIKCFDIWETNMTNIE